MPDGVSVARAGRSGGGAVRQVHELHGPDAAARGPAGAGPGGAGFSAARCLGVGAAHLVAQAGAGRTGKGPARRAGPVRGRSAQDGHSSEAAGAARACALHVRRCGLGPRSRARQVSDRLLQRGAGGRVGRVDPEQVETGAAAAVGDGDSVATARGTGAGLCSTAGGEAGSAVRAGTPPRSRDAAAERDAVQCPPTAQCT